MIEKRLTSLTGLKPISELKKERQSHVITREEYWREIKERLSPISDLIEISNRENLSFQIDSSGIEIEIPLEDYKLSVKMVFDISDIRSVPFTVVAEGPYEHFQAKILFALGLKSKIFLDIGANMGYYSLALGVLNPQIKIYSFEPQPKIFSILEKNISLNGIGKQVTAHNCGLGSHARNQKIYIPKFTGSGGGSFANQHLDEGIAEEVVVPVHKLDELISPSTAVDLMKIDVEGYEFEMLQGGQRALEQYKPTLIIELLRKWMKAFGKHPQDVIDLLKPLGYEVFSIGAENLSLISTIDEETAETNFIFINKNNITHYEVIEKYLKH